jgi:hypothetical protein
MAVTARVTICNSHRDLDLRTELDKHLAMLRRTGLIELRRDRSAGCDEYPGYFETAIESADVILLLVSHNFLASDYCYEFQARRALEQHRQKRASVIPVILRPCDWEVTSFAELPAAPADARPVTTWRNRDEAFMSVVRIVRKRCDYKLSGE